MWNVTIRILYYFYIYSVSFTYLWQEHTYLFVIKIHDFYQDTRTNAILIYFRGFYSNKKDRIKFHHKNTRSENAFNIVSKFFFIWFQMFFLQSRMGYETICERKLRNEPHSLYCTSRIHQNSILNFGRQHHVKVLKFTQCHTDMRTTTTYTHTDTLCTHITLPQTLTDTEQNSRHIRNHNDGDVIA